MKNLLRGFSGLSREQKIRIISEQVFYEGDLENDLSSFLHPDKNMQEKLESFSENTLANFPVPFGIAPNFLINGKTYHVPMVVEESSVVAAASYAARFWAERGGFHAKVTSTVKIGQVHFSWRANSEELKKHFPDLKNYLIQNTMHLTENMRKRGGGMRDIELIDLTGKIDNYYQLKISFETAESMGANFINSCLEEAGRLMKVFFTERKSLVIPEIIMAILSNYTPDCIVETTAECSISDLNDADNELLGKAFAEKFKTAVEIAQKDTFRAVTHNKGIFNGIDAVIIATGNDFRAVEAAGHAFASRQGNYSSLSYVNLENDRFVFGLRLPMSVGTVGGLTRLHPLSEISFRILGDPEAKELMMIAASAGLAANFAALRSLITKGIQKGHMKLHLGNILNFLNAQDDEKRKAFEHFESETVSYSKVEEFLQRLRNND